jgi:hypothetical protein
VIARNTPSATTTPKTNPSDFRAMSPSWHQIDVAVPGFKEEAQKNL